MKFLITGLGNPGRGYARTRHNVGFLVVEALAADLGCGFTNKDSYEVAEVSYGGHSLVLLKPLTFMNLSGRAVRSVLKKHQSITPAQLLVAYDDLDLPVGRLRLREGGSGGGHKGVRSIIDENGSNAFFQLRIGIDKPPLREIVPDYVLEPFSPREEEVIGDAVRRAVDCIKSFVTDGAAVAMNRFNAETGAP